MTPRRMEDSRDLSASGPAFMEIESNTCVYAPLPGTGDKTVIITIDPAGSVYNAAIFMPLIRGTYFNAAILLVVNFIMQAFMTWKMLQITRYAGESNLKAIEAMCQPAQSANMPWYANGTFPPENTYLDCGSLLNNIMNNVDYLDLDTDGNWTAEEAKKLEADAAVASPGRVSTVSSLFDNIKDFMVAEAGAKATANDSRPIPMAWLRDHQTEFTLCEIQDEALCNNLEVRGLLPKLLVDEPSPDSRINACKDLFDDTGFCTQIFGTRYDWYIAHRASMCGDATYVWDDNMHLNSVIYEEYQHWIGQDSVTSSTFASFLVIILLVWIMLMVAEFHEILRWILVLLAVPTVPSTNQPYLEDNDGKVHIHAIPSRHRTFCILMVWLPRASVFVLILIVGTLFLSYAQNYIDLLFNATALGFLIGMDELLYSACSDDDTKRMIEAVEPIEVVSRNPVLAIHQTYFTIFYTFLMFLFTVFYVYNLYFSLDGKFVFAKDVECLCQVSGDLCLPKVLLELRIKALQSLSK